MAVIEARLQEETIQASCLKPKHILVINDDNGKKDYIRVCSITKAKTGKHGAAKAIITGKDLKTGRSYVNSFVGTNSVSIASLTKKQFILEDILYDDECLYMRPNDSSNEASDSYPYNNWEQEDIDALLKAYKENNEEELVVTINVAPGFFSLEDVRPFKQ